MNLCAYHTGQHEILLFELLFINIEYFMWFSFSCISYSLYSHSFMPRCEFRSAARDGPSGHGWPYSGDQVLVTIVGPTVIVSVLPTLAANTGNQRWARPSARLWPRLEPTVGPTLANYFRWPWQFSRPISGPRLNQSSTYY